jgi:two-component system response regulator DesR
MSERPTAERPLRVLVVDDHDVVHWGLRIMLGRLPWVERCDAARNGAEALALARDHQPDLALVDLFVGQESGPEICERLHLVRRGLRVLLISGAGQISASAAAACGASGFLSKDRRGEDIVRAARMVGMGMSLFEQAPAPGSAPAGRPVLSGREREVLALVATGATNREIAERLKLSPHTVKEYASAVYRKLDARNRIEAVTQAERLRLTG